MKIGIDCRLWNESGVGRYIRNLVQQLVQLDKDNEYVLFGFGKNREQILRYAQNDKARFVQTNFWWHTIEEQLQFPKILNKESLDLVHFPYISVPVLYDKPFMVTIHDLIPFSFPTGQASTLPLPLYYLKLAGYKYIVKKAAQKAKKIITVSESSKKDIISRLHVQSSKIEVTYEAPSSKLKTQNSKLKFKAQNYFLYVGSAYPHKNLERLIEAFRDVILGSEERATPEALNVETCLPAGRDSGQARMTKQLKLVFVGKEDYFYKRLKQKVKESGLKDNVVFTNFVSDEELSFLYGNALAYIAPSFMEGFDLPVLEAMNNKCLVIVSDIPIHREICDNAAIYFDPYNISDITEKLNNVINSKDLLNTFREKGFEISTNYSWEKTTQKTLKIYQSIIQK